MINNVQGIYRGKVVANYDPFVKGRVKLWIPGVYPEAFLNKPDELPWAEPVMPIFGGNFTNLREGDLNSETGITTIPHVGTEVWVFFEGGNQQYPKFFGACQGGDGWHSEHNNQHVIKTDNVTVRIDEEPTLPRFPRIGTVYNTVTKFYQSETKWNTYFDMMENYLNMQLGKTLDSGYTVDLQETFVLVDVDFEQDKDAAEDFKKYWDDYFTSEIESGNLSINFPTTILSEETTNQIDPEPADISTCKFDSYNKNCTYTSQARRKYDTPTRMDIFVHTKGLNAVNLRVSGDINMSVTGDVFEEIYGDKHETLSGNFYKHHIGDEHIVHNGNSVIESEGRNYHKHIGNQTETIDGSRTEFITSGDRQTVIGDKRSTVGDIRVNETWGNQIDTVAGERSNNTIGSSMNITLGEVTEIANSIKRLADYDITDISLQGNIDEQAFCDIINVAQNGHIYHQAMCNIFSIAKMGSQYNEALYNIFNIVKNGGIYNEAVSGICNITTGNICNNADVSGSIFNISDNVIYDKAPRCYRQGKFLVQDYVDSSIGTIQHSSIGWTDLPPYDNVVFGLVIPRYCSVNLSYSCGCGICSWDNLSASVADGWVPCITSFFYNTATYFSTFIDLSSQNLVDDSICDYTNN